MTALVLFVDALTGPTAFTHTGTHKGENDLGCYLDIFGFSFGSFAGLGSTTRVFIGGVEVANYRALGGTKAFAKFPGLQCLRVQVGALGNAPAGTPLNVDVRVDGVSCSYHTLFGTVTFTPCVGRCHFASLAGDDNTAVIGDINHPWRHLQISVNQVITGGMSVQFVKGDHCYVRAGDWSDAMGQDTNWFRFRYPNIQQGDPLNHFVFKVYPGSIMGNAPEDVHYSTSAHCSGGIHGAEGNGAGVVGDYVTVSGFRFDMDALANADAAPVNTQSSWLGWRCINNKIGPWPSSLHSKGAGFEGHAQHSVCLANEIFSLNCVGAQETHGVYADSGATDWQVAFNYVHDITGGNLVQFFDNNIDQAQPGWNGFERMDVFCNWLENCKKFGLNLANSFISGRIWNNVIIGSSLAPIRFEISYPMAPYNGLIQFNTCYNCDVVTSGGGNVQVYCDNANADGAHPQSGHHQISDNIFCAGPNTVADIPYGLEGSSFFQFARNNWYSPGHWNAGNVAKDATALFLDPKFTNPAAGDFSLQPSSPMIDAATTTLFDPVCDFTFILTRPQGSLSDLGAFELAGTPPPPPPPPSGNRVLIIN